MVERIGTVGVVGAGVIGTSLAQELSQAGHQVVLVDVEDAQLADAPSRIASAARLHHLVAGGERHDPEKVLSRIVFSTDYTLLQEVDLVIENVTEDRAVKRDVYQELDRVCRADCPIAANTSVIPISTIASYSRRPQNIVGIHFMNPVPLTRAVELIAGERTAPPAIDAATTLLRQLDKHVIRVGDSPGFVSNRVLMQMINEAAFLVYEDVADPRSVDDVFKLCFGHKMGPLETADLIGLDTILRSVEGLEFAFADEKYRPCPLLRQMVDRGELGQKSGRGFYTYQTGLGLKGERR